MGSLVRLVRVHRLCLRHLMNWVKLPRAKLWSLHQQEMAGPDQTWIVSQFFETNFNPTEIAIADFDGVGIPNCAVVTEAGVSNVMLGKWRWLAALSFLYGVSFYDPGRFLTRRSSFAVANFPDKNS